MSLLPTVYLLVSGASTVHRTAELVAGLGEHFARVLCAQTPGSMQLISPLELSRMPGNGLVNSYLDDALQPRPPVAPVVFAPCSFNSMNKLAHGIADNLALSIAAEMIGRRQRVVVALSFNDGLWAHPAVTDSVATLRSWGMQIVEPMNTTMGLTMAPVETIIRAITGEYT